MPNQAQSTTKSCLMLGNHTYSFALYTGLSCQRCCSLPAVGVWIPLEHHVILYYLDVDDIMAKIYTHVMWVIFCLPVCYPKI